MPDACATPAAARLPLPVSRRCPSPSAAHVPAHRGATACRCTTASSAPASISSPSTWDWTRWSRHFAEVDQAKSYASVLSFQIEEVVETEDFAEAASLKQAILEASADNTFAHVMADSRLPLPRQSFAEPSGSCEVEPSPRDDASLSTLRQSARLPAPGSS